MYDISLNDKELLKIYFVLAFENPEPKRTTFFIFMKRGYFQTPKLLLLSQQRRSKDLFEIFSIVRLFLFPYSLTDITSSYNK